MMLAAALILLGSCKPQVPSEYIQPGDMEDILYDYHVAQGIADAENMTAEQARALKLSVYAKHEVSEEQFNSSLQYYMRHTEKLHDMYEGITERLQAEAESQGSSAAEVGQYGSLTTRGDTADVWRGQKAMVLLPYAPYNEQSFAIKADTSFHKGDRLMMTFDSQFIIQEGARDGVCVMAITTQNDSVTMKVQRIMSDSHNVLTIDDTDSLGIKQIRGFFLLSRGPGFETTSTLKMLILSNIKLIRMHMNGTSPTGMPTGQQPTEPIRTIGGSAVNPQQQGMRTPSLQLNGDEKPVPARTPQDAMRERHIPLPPQVQKTMKLKKNR